MCCNCNRRPIYRISKRRVNQNSLSHQSQKIAQNKLYCFIDWFNLQWSFSVILLACKKKEPTLCLPLFYYVAFIANSKIAVRFRVIFIPGKEFHRSESNQYSNQQSSLIQKSYTILQTSTSTWSPKLEWEYLAGLTPLLIRNYPLQLEMFCRSQSWGWVIPSSRKKQFHTVRKS